MVDVESAYSSPPTGQNTAWHMLEGEKCGLCSTIQLRQQKDGSMSRQMPLTSIGKMHFRWTTTRMTSSRSELTYTSEPVHWRTPGDICEVVHAIRAKENRRANNQTYAPRMELDTVSGSLHLPCEKQQWPPREIKSWSGRKCGPKSQATICEWSAVTRMLHVQAKVDIPKADDCATRHSKAVFITRSRPDLSWWSCFVRTMDRQCRIFSELYYK